MKNYLICEDSGQAVVEYVVVLGGFVVIAFGFAKMLSGAVGGSLAQGLARTGKVEIIINKN